MTYLIEVAAQQIVHLIQGQQCREPRIMNLQKQSGIVSMIKEHHHTTVQGHFHKQHNKKHRIFTNFVGLRERNLKREVNPDVHQCWNMTWQALCDCSVQCRVSLESACYNQNCFDVCAALAWWPLHESTQTKALSSATAAVELRLLRHAVVPHMLSGCCQPAHRRLPGGRGLRSEPASA